MPCISGILNNDCICDCVHCTFFFLSVSEEKKMFALINTPPPSTSVNTNDFQSSNGAFKVLVYIYKVGRYENDVRQSE